MGLSVSGKVARSAVSLATLLTIVAIRLWPSLDLEGCHIFKLHMELFIKAIRKIFWIFEPLPPLFRILARSTYSTKLTQSPLLLLLGGQHPTWRGPPL